MSEGIDAYNLLGRGKRGKEEKTFGNCYKLKVQKGQKAPNVRLVSM